MSSPAVRKTCDFKVLSRGGILLFLVVFAGAGQAAAQCVQPPSGLVSWWAGDGDFLDMQDGNDAILVSGMTFDSGLVGQGFRALRGIVWVKLSARECFRPLHAGV